MRPLITSRLGCGALACSLLDSRERPRHVLQGLPLGPHAEEDLNDGGEDHQPSAQEVLDWQVDEIEKEGGEIAKAHLRIGKPYEEILHVSEEIVAGLIVVGNQGFGQKFSRLKRFLMGSTSENVSRYARCSVMVVRKDLYDRPSA